MVLELSRFQSLSSSTLESDDCREIDKSADRRKVPTLMVESRRCSHRAPKTVVVLYPWPTPLRQELFLCLLYQQSLQLLTTHTLWNLLSDDDTASALFVPSQTFA